MIKIKIDVTKINKARLFKGEKGTYLDAVLIPTPDNKYGNDYMIVESVSLEEKEKGVEGAILGNAKILTAKEKKEPLAPTNQVEEKDEQLPF